MLTIVRHIEYLLEHNDCVVVPGFGAFIGNIQSAKEDATGQLLPPCRVLGFNNAITHNDGVLANSIMRRDGVSYAKAVSIIEEDVRTVKIQLKQDDEYCFGDVGVFRRQDETLLFNPGLHSIGNLSYFGLQPLLWDGESEECNEDKSDYNRRFVFSARNILRAVASIAILIVFAITLTTPINIDEVDYASVAHFEPQKVDLGVNVSNNQKKPTDIKADVIEASHKPTSISYSRYYVVIGSFSSKSQAQRFAKESGIAEAEVLDASKGSSIYKVVVAGGDSHKELQHLISERNLCDRFPDVWICRR